MRGVIVRYPGCIFDEVEPTIRALTSRFEFDVVDLNEVTPDLDADFLVIPGGDCAEAVTHDGLLALVREVAENGLLVAGICNGVLVLGAAGVLDGRRCTHTAHPKYASGPEFRELLEFVKNVFPDATYIDEDVVVSGSVITAKPAAAEAFASAIVQKLS